MVYRVQFVTRSVCFDSCCVRARNFTNRLVVEHVVAEFLSRSIRTIVSRDIYLLIVRDTRYSSIRTQIFTALLVR